MAKELPNVNPRILDMVLAGVGALLVTLCKRSKHDLFDAVIRDFKEDHPDFQSFDGPYASLVLPFLDGDKKPVWNPKSFLVKRITFQRCLR